MINVWDSRKRFDGIEVGSAKLNLLGREHLLNQIDGSHKPLLCMTGYGPHSWKLVAGSEDGTLRSYVCPLRATMPPAAAEPESQPAAEVDPAPDGEAPGEPVVAPEAPAEEAAASANQPAASPMARKASVYT